MIIAALRIVGLANGCLGIFLGCWTQNWGLAIIAAFSLLAIIFNLAAETHARENWIPDDTMAAFHEENRRRRAGEIK